MENQQSPLPEQPTPPITPPPAFVQPATAPGRKKGWLIGIIIAAVLLLVGAIGVMVAYNNAKNQYATQAAAFETKAKGAYEFMRDLRDRQQFGDQIKSTFDDALMAAPKSNKFLLLPLGSPEATKRVDNLRTELDGLKSSYLNIIALTKYGDELNKIFLTLSGTINTPDDMRAILPKLQKAKTDLEKLTPPEGAVELHGHILTGFAAVIDDIEKALAAYDAGKSDEFTTHIEKLVLDVKLVNINVNLTELSKIYGDYQTKADTHYDNLEKLVTSPQQ